MADKKRVARVLEDPPNYPRDILGMIFDLQKEFGKKFCSFDNLTPAEQEDWTNKFLDCIVDEISEVRDWLPWKHWKDYEDFQYEPIEIKFELIDILHFVVSIALVSGKRYEGLKKDGEIFLDLDRYITRTKGSVLSKYGIDPDRDLEAKNTLTNYLLRDFISKIGYYYSHPNVGKEKDLLEVLFKLFAVWGMDSREIYKLYYSKNRENHARQERGY